MLQVPRYVITSNGFFSDSRKLSPFGLLTLLVITVSLPFSVNYQSYWSQPTCSYDERYIVEVRGFLLFLKQVEKMDRFAKGSFAYWFELVFNVERLGF